MKRILVCFMLVLSLSLTACGNDRVCLQGHDEAYTYMMPIQVGTINGIPQYTYIPQDRTRFVCDEYAAEVTS